MQELVGDLADVVLSVCYLDDVDLCVGGHGQAVAQTAW